MQRLRGNLILLVLGLFSSAGVLAQSTVGELLEKGGRQMTRDDFLQNLPARIQQEWPNRQGEEELFFSVDGKITGTGTHYASRTKSPAEGTWRIEDDGKFCAPKRFTAWGSSTNLCWYGYLLGNDLYASMKAEPDSKVFKANSFGKVVADAK